MLILSAIPAMASETCWNGTPRPRLEDGGRRAYGPSNGQRDYRAAREGTTMEQNAIDPAAAAAGATIGLGMMIVWLAVCLLMLISVWKIFSKAGQPGWAAIIPFYNLYVFLKVAGKPGWWMAIILLVPVANIIFSIMALAAMAKNFGKGGGFVVGMIFLPVIFYPILGFGSAQYRPVAS